MDTSTNPMQNQILGGNSENPSEEFVIESLKELAGGEYRETEREYEGGELYFLEITVGNVQSGTYKEITYLTKGTHARGGSSETTGITVMEYEDGYPPFATNYDYVDRRWVKTN